MRGRCTRFYIARLVRAGGCWIAFCGCHLSSHLSEIAVTKIASEIERFNRFSVTWWDAEGPMRPLHIVNALRLGYVIERIALHLGLSTSNISLENVRILDVGCGGGLLSEPLARLGAKVVGVDASKGNIEAARLHAASQGVGVDYRLGEPSEVLGPNERFDVVLALEVVEHVSDVATFLDTTARSVAPGGLLFVSTIDRTLNNIWRVRKPRPFAQRVLIYWAAITLGPLLLGVSLTITSYVLSASKGVVGAMPGGVELLLNTMQFLLVAMAAALPTSA